VIATGAPQDLMATLDCLYGEPLDYTTDFLYLRSIGQEIEFVDCNATVGEPGEGGGGTDPLAEPLCQCEQSTYFAGLNEFNCDELEIIYFYHPDYLGSTEFITDMRGEPYQFFLNTPWGENLENQYAKSYTSFSSRFRFNGKEWDEETGNYYYGARYYDPKVSVWLSVDPLSHLSPSQTPYHFVNNNPIVFIDPDGRNANPVYDLDGNHLGNTEEGFTGEILIYSGSEEVDFSTMSADDAKSMGGVSTLNDEVGTGSISGDAFSNIMTNIAQHFDGSEIFHNVNFDFDQVGGKIYSGDDPESQFYYEDNKIFAVQDDQTMDYAVENVQSAIIAHEYYSHHILGQSDTRGNHRLSYMNEMKYIHRNNVNVTPRYYSQTLNLLKSQISKDNPRLNVDAEFKRLKRTWMK